MIPKTADEIRRGEHHAIADAPVKGCWCATCKPVN